MHTWAILTGEYPPQPGGVADYTRQVACALANGGDRVFVWTPPHNGKSPTDSGVTVEHLNSHFGHFSLRKLERDLRKLPKPRCLLVQYVPHSYGCKAMNVIFTNWLSGLKGFPLKVMFHEVAFPIQRGQRFKHRILANITRYMASRVATAADEIYVSIPAWGNILRELAPNCVEPEWLPVPSNLPVKINPNEVWKLRTTVQPQRSAMLIGHFGTYQLKVCQILQEVLPPIFTADPSRRGILLGRGGQEFLKTLISKWPSLGGRISAMGELEPDQIVKYLAGCDLLIQPFPDGISARRTSVMSGIALGIPTISTKGDLTESIWVEEKAVELGPIDQPGQLVSLAEDLLCNPDRRFELGKNAIGLYQKRFSLENMIRQLHSSKIT